MEPRLSAQYEIARVLSESETLAEAISLACAEPPGPVHLDLPEDVSAGLASGTAPRLPKRVVHLPNVSEELTGGLSEALARSRRPIVLTGLSFTRSQSAGSLLRFIENHTSVLTSPDVLAAYRRILKEGGR